MNSVTFEHVAYAAALTVGSVSILFVGSVLVICLVKKFGDYDDE
jgi:hypothetical protein